MSVADFLEVLMRLPGSAPVWVVVGAAITLLGAVIGGTLSIAGAWKKSQEDAQNYAAQTERIIGAPDTFCQLIAYFDPEDAVWQISTLHRGGGPIYDVQVLIREVREDGAPVGRYRRVNVGTVTSTTWPQHLHRVGPPRLVSRQGTRYFNAQITQRNGVSGQDIAVIPKPNGGIQIAFIRLTFQGKDVEPYFGDYVPRARWTMITEEEKARILELRAERDQRVRRENVEREKRGWIR